MRHAFIVVVLSVLLVSCSTTSVVNSFPSPHAQSDSNGRATVWIDDNPISYGLIKKVDGKKINSWACRQPPCSIGLTPGKHKLDVYFHLLTNLNPFSITGGGKTANFQLDVDVVADHSYMLEFKNEESQIAARLVDLGPNVECRYEERGGKSWGYVPVALVCDQ